MEDLSEALDEIAAHLEVSDEHYKAPAYRRAADVVRTADAIPPDPKQMHGIGDSIRDKIIEFRATGSIDELDELRDRYPYVTRLTKIDGIGPKTAKQLYEDFGAETIRDVSEMCETGEIKTVSGIGDATAETIKESVERLK